MLTFVILTITH